MVALITPIQQELVSALAPAPCVPPVALGFCPLCLAQETRRESAASGMTSYLFGCGSRLDAGPDGAKAVITSAEYCMQGYNGELIKTLRAVSEVAQTWPPTTAALQEVEAIASAKLSDLAIYTIR